MTETLPRSEGKTLLQDIPIERRGTARFKRSPIAVAVCIALCLVAGAPFAQTLATPTPTPTAEPTGTAQPSIDPHNGFAENLKPIRARNGSKAVALNTPYAPIRKVDDEGQVLEIEMFVGESRIFPAPGVSRIAVGNGQAMTAAAIDGKEVILFANQTGTSSLFLWNADGRYQRVKISIVPGDTTRFAREIAAFLSSIPKAKASIVGASVIVEGDELSDPDLAKIEDLAKRYPQIVNFTNRVGWEQMVLMDVKVVEFPTSLLRNVGLNWTSTGGAAIGGIWAPLRLGNAGAYALNGPAAGAVTTVDGTTSLAPSKLNALSILNLGLSAQLELLQQEGKATMLAQPQLSARSGSKASFVAGGEIPYAVQTLEGPRVLFKEYGVKLDITPKVDHTGIIRSTIIAEVSSIDNSVQALGGPALLTRKTQTEFNLRDGETIVLSGLLQRNASTDVDKIPFLGDIPVLGALFRSKHFQNKETELVVFVTPTIVDARSKGNVDRIQRTNERLTERLGPQPHLTEPLQPSVDAGRPHETLTVGSRIDPALIDDGRPAPQLVRAAPITPLPEAVTRRPIESVKSSPFDGKASVGTSIDLSMVPASSGGALLTVVAASTVLRTNAGLNSPAVMQLDRGSAVQMGRAEVKETSSGSWRNVMVGSVVGWVPADAVRPARLQPGDAISADSARSAAVGRNARRQLDAAPAGKPLTLTAAARPDGPKYRVAVEGLAMRITPDVNGDVVRRLEQGETVTAVDQAARGGWQGIQIGQGETIQRGWVASQWLIPVAP